MCYSVGLLSRPLKWNIEKSPPWNWQQLSDKCPYLGQTLLFVAFLSRNRSKSPLISNPLVNIAAHFALSDLRTVFKNQDAPLFNSFSPCTLRYISTPLRKRHAPMPVPHYESLPNALKPTFLPANLEISVVLHPTLSIVHLTARNERIA